MTPTISAACYLERIGPEPDSRSAIELIWIQATVSRIRIACEKMTPPALEMLRASAAGAASLPTRPGWERKAAAHAEVFRLLAQIAGDRAGGNPGGEAGIARRVDARGWSGRQRDDHQLPAAAARASAHGRRRCHGAGNGNPPPGPALHVAADLSILRSVTAPVSMGIVV